MPDVSALAESILALVVQAIDSLFRLLFFWLPDDPFADTITGFVNNFSAEFYNPIRWLNWFVDVGYISGLLAALVAILLAWAAYKLAVHIFSTTAKAIELIPFE